MRPDAWKEQIREELRAELERLDAQECGLRAQRQDTIYWLEQVIPVAPGRTQKFSVWSHQIHCSH